MNRNHIVSVAPRPLVFSVYPSRKANSIGCVVNPACQVRLSGDIIQRKVSFGLGQREPALTGKGEGHLEHIYKLCA